MKHPADANSRSASSPLRGAVKPPRRRSLARLLPRGCWRRALSVSLVVVMLATQTPATTLVLAGTAARWRADLAFWARAGRWPAALGGLFAAGQGRRASDAQEQQRERDARVSRVVIHPGDVTLRVGDRINFAAVAYDADGAPVGGVAFAWGVREAGAGRRERVSRTGEFVAQAAGRYRVTAEGAGRQAQAHVVVQEPPGGPRGRATKRKVEPFSTRDLPPAETSRAPGMEEQQRRTRAKSAAGPRFVKTSYDGGGKTADDGGVKSRAASAAASAVAPAAARVRLDYDYQWNQLNYLAADDPDNRRGDIPGAASDGGAGNGNFQMVAPVLSLPGRGLDLSLDLAYNSRVWNKANGEIAFDLDRDWPAPGWSLGFGKLIGLSGGGALLIEGDGTRHPATGQVFGGTSFRGHTTDGTFIDYTHSSYANGDSAGGTAKFPDGTVIEYGAIGRNIAYPVSVTDANGNRIVITYRNNTGPQIDTITDTLGRVVLFHYDAAGLLTAVTAPGLSSGERTLVRLHYKQHTLDYSFSVPARVQNATVALIDAVYYPATATGYWFGDPDSYSSYGMITKASERRGMGFAANSLTEQGAFTFSGHMTRQVDYDYPPTPTSPLDDAPTYTRATETWAGAELDAVSAETRYEVYQNATPRRTEITLPNGVKNIQYSYNAPGQYYDGLVFRDETKDAAGNLLQTSHVDWGQGDYSSPRPLRAETVDHEIGKKTATGFVYGPAHNQVAEVRDYDYTDVDAEPSSVLRLTRTEYEDAAGYADRHIFNLVKRVSVFDGDGFGARRVSLVEYRYDGQPLQNAPGVVMHSEQYNPHAPVEEVCGWEDDPGDPDYQNPGCAFEPFNNPRCDGVVNQIYVCRNVTLYWPATDFRGNVTQVKSYADAAAGTGETVETRRYDITGNLVSMSSSCCERTTFAYAASTQYAYLTSRTSGSPTDPAQQVSASTSYDFNTGLVMTSTDENGRTSKMRYQAATLRPEKALAPTGAFTLFDYDEVALKVTDSTYLGESRAGAVLAARGTKYLNGRGQVRREEALGAGGAVDVIETRYDKLGRVWKQTQPFRNTLPEAEWKWTENFYDDLGRLKKTVAADGSTAETFYNEAARPGAASSAPGQTTRARDPWGRERWGRTDAQGHLVEVVEPAPSGGGSVFEAGSLRTTYAYDALGDLVEVAQGAQRRRFEYDGLGRLLRQKQAEANATLDSAGSYLGVGAAGAEWSDVFAYDARSNLVARTDARGVKTILKYTDSADNPDPLNRLQSISYDKSGVPEPLRASVADAATVTYSYGVNSDGSALANKSLLSRVRTAGVGEEVYTFDGEARVIRKRLTLDARAAYPLETDYEYDALNRVWKVTYPRQYGVGVINPARKVVEHEYDVASRLAGLKVDGASYAAGVVYNAASQATELKVGAAGANQITERYDYDAATGLLSEQKVYRGADSPASRLMHLAYDYLRPGTNAGRTGQLTKITDRLNSQRGRTYSYDALGRLTQATGGDPTSAPQWTQTYEYDRYGNRKTVTAAGSTTAKAEKFSAPRPAAGRVEVASNFGPPPLPEFLRGGARRPASDAPAAPSLPPPAPGGAAFLDAPANLAVASASAAQVSLSWTAPAGAVSHYRVERSQSLAGPYEFLANSTSTALADTNVEAGKAYLYRVRAVDGVGNNSAFSNVALGATFTFADDPIITHADDPTGQTATKIKAQHVTQLRAAVNAVRLTAGLPLASWTDATLIPQGTPVRAAHVQELRDKLNEALAALQIGTPPFTDPALSTGAGGTPVRRAHVAELRLRSTRGRSASSGGGGASVPVPRDGHASLSYDEATNRINSPGWEYDAAGNQTRVLGASGVWQRMVYDAANRLVGVKSDAHALLVSYTYGATNARLAAEGGGARTYYASDNGTVLAEYGESGTAALPQWTKSYFHLGGRLLATAEPGTSSEVVQYHHPDRLGTRLITSASDASYTEQATLPFGTVLWAETTAITNRRFTSYDRSATTGLDYAVNRRYDPLQGRFTQVDPIGAGAADATEPQTWNMYAYCGNDPVNRTDPDGLFFGRLFRWIGRVLKWIAIAAAVAAAVISVIGWVVGPVALQTFLTTTTLGKVLGFVANIPNIIGSFISGIPKTIAGIFSLTEMGEATVARLLGFAALLGGGAAAEETGKARRRREKRERRAARERPRPTPPRPVQLPPGISPEPPKGTPGVQQPPREPPPIGNDPENPRMPDGGTRWQRFRFRLAIVVRGIGGYINRRMSIIMVNPETIQDVACKENPFSDMCINGPFPGCCPVRQPKRPRA